MERVSLAVTMWNFLLEKPWIFASSLLSWLYLLVDFVQILSSWKVWKCLQMRIDRLLMKLYNVYFFAACNNDRCNHVFR